MALSLNQDKNTASVVPGVSLLRLAVPVLLFLTSWLLTPEYGFSSDATALLVLAAISLYTIGKRSQTFQFVKHTASERVLVAFFMLLAMLSSIGISYSTLFHSLFLSVAVTALWLAAITALFGRHAMRDSIFAVVIMLLLIPQIQLFETFLSFPMRRLSAEATAMILRLWDDRVWVEGTVIQYQTSKLTVTSACDGLTLMQNLLWIGWLRVMTRYETLPMKFLIMTTIIPTVLIANTIRILLLTLWVSFSGQEVLTTAWHEMTGWFAVVLAALIFLFLESLIYAGLKDDPKSSH